MFQNLLSPLKARFDQLSPRSPSASFQPIGAVSPHDDLLQNPEDFARDVLVQLMRNSVEELKLADGQRAKCDILVEIQRIMLQDSFTKNVFRELDGFLVLMSVLSTIQDRQLSTTVEVVEPDEQLVQETIECARLVFVVLSEAIQDHRENSEYFRGRVGYESLEHALRGLVSASSTVDETLGFLLSLGLSDFALAGLFTTLRIAQGDEDLDAKIAVFQTRLGTIIHPEPMAILWTFATSTPSACASPSIRYGLYKLFEALFHVNHRNQGVLSSLSLVKSVFSRFYESRNDAAVSERERHALQKLLRRLLEMGPTTDEARRILQKAVVNGEQEGEEKLDGEILDLVRFGMKSRWLEHFSMETPAALVLADENKGLPTTGFTFMMWIYLSSLPTKSGHALFTASLPSREFIKLSLTPEGKLDLISSSQDEPRFVSSATIRKNRWAHVTLVHYPHKGTNPTIRLFLDGVLHDMLNWQYPKPDSAPQRLSYRIGDTDESAGKMSWCLASAYLISAPLGEDIPRFIHHLGPRYSGNFQDPGLVKFLTYEASTSLNMFLTSVSSKHYANPLSPSAISPQVSQAPPLSISAALSMKSPPPLGYQTQPTSNKPVLHSGMMKVVKHGLGVSESQIVFSFSAADCERAGEGLGVKIPVRGRLRLKVKAQPRDGLAVLDNKESAVEIEGDIFVVKAACLDMALWKIGGAAVALRVVQLAKTSHELSRALGILTDGLKNSWQNSEDMERLRGYEILANILRLKAQYINLTAFETLFEFLGINFGSPEHSTVVNVIAYRVIALDFDLWSRARKEIQQVYLEHFTTLLRTSRYKNFNAKQRLTKMGLVRKLLFALQAEWYQGDTVQHVMDALKVSAHAIFSKEETIKPVVSYLAANLHEAGGGTGTSSPHSIISRFEVRNPQEKAEQILEILISILSDRTCYTKFVTALPINRICLLLLGDRPTPFVAVQILRLVGMSIRYTSSFSRKFELISGWSVLKIVLPTSWSPEVNMAAFDILLGRFEGGDEAQTGLIERGQSDATTVTCPHIVPTILAALHNGLTTIAGRAHISDVDEVQFSWETEQTMEILIEEIMNLHSSSPTFREIFRSQQTTQQYIDAYKSFISKLKLVSQINQWNTRMLEKLTHVGLAFALDNAVAGSQKREILDALQTADAMLNPSSPTSLIDPGLIVDTRSVRQRIASARFSMQVGERTVIKTMARMTEWRKTIQVSEKKRLRKTILDLREQRRRVSRLQAWTNLLTSERGLWPHHEPRLWRLDETEGPHRIRKKLEPQNDKSPSSRVDTLEQMIRDVHPPESETPSVHQPEVPPWAESYEISATDMDDKQLAEDIVDDKLRRVRHELEPGDVIEAVATVARIAGVDSSPGLLIIGRTHIYMLDGVVENDEGEVIDAHDSPKRLLFIPGSIVELDGPQRAQRWAHNQIATCSDKRFLFRDVALEVYFKDSRSLLVVFLDKKRRLDIDQRLSTIINKNHSDPAQAPGLPKTPLFGRMGSRMLSGFRADELSSTTRRWQAREISNFTYLSILNQISGRTPSDATQYPIFPWVLADYTSETLDLTAPESYRDLTNPMGALTPARRQAAEARYENLESVGEEPFHYGTHFSSSMIVCHFLIRMAPFTNMFKTLQGGDWDLPDRLFSDLPRAYLSAADDLRGDVRELIPEFFTCPEFLENSANHDFGVLQQSGERIHDVKLPPWARQDPLLFIALNRRALESTYVSEHLPRWIDLIWGSKQRDPASLNVFHPLSYEGSIDLDKIEDDLEREATVGIIHNFGQTPRKLFTNPHPERLHHGLSTLPIGTLHGVEEDPHLLVQAARCFKDLGPTVAVHDFVPDAYGEKLIPCADGTLCIPQHPHEHIEWKVGNAELRVLVDHKPVQVIENAFCNCAAFADATNLITGSSDYTVRLWKVIRGHHSADLHLSLSHIMRVHTDEVVCVTASRAWSSVVSGSKDGSAAFWDLNRGGYVRSIWHGEERGEGGDTTAINLVAIMESTGYVATCSRLKLCLHTINGRSIATLDLTKTSSFSPLVPTITSLAFHERDYSHLGVLATGGPDGTITLRTWTADGTPPGEKAQWEFLVIRAMKARMGKNGRPMSVTALKFSGEYLYHGEENGKSFIWNLPE